MTLRPTQNTTFRLVQAGMDRNRIAIARAHEQAATGRRILKPSDDAVGTAMSMAIRRQSSAVSSYLGAIESSTPLLANGASELQNGSGLLTEARALIVQGMNGTLSQTDRDAIASELELIAESLLGIGNARVGEKYLFGGTATGSPPFQESTVGGRSVVTYEGDDGEHSVLVSRSVTVATNVPGSDVFARLDPTSVSYDGLTGISGGTSANSGAGYHDLHLRHDATLGAPGAGLTLAAGGANDTILGDHTLVIDAAARTAQLGSGAPVSIPTPLPADLELRDADGSVVHIDFTGWTGVDDTTVLTGEGSIALNDGSFQAINLTETDLELVDDASGVSLHVDTTSVTRAGTELVSFRGATNVFDTLRGIADDLRNGSDLATSEVVSRVTDRLEEFDRHQDNLLLGLATLGGRSARLELTESRLRDLEVGLESRRSNIEDADLAETILALTRAETTLQAAQATGARLLQQSLLNFLR